jgi:hypothetical protein
VGRTLLSAALDVGSELNRVGPAASKYCPKEQSQRRRTKPVLSEVERECPPHTRTSAATLQQQTSSDKGEDPHRHGGHHPCPKNRAVVWRLNKEMMQHMNKVQRQKQYRNPAQDSQSSHRSFRLPETVSHRFPPTPTTSGVLFRFVSARSSPGRRFPRSRPLVLRWEDRRVPGQSSQPRSVATC